ncbi:MAG: AgmX/PglI C-terminal domain-containing protein, partial [Curvibacter sp.]
RGRATRSDIKLGICGEHGGDPKSVKFCDRIGLDYVSCSPYRVPIARLAAAQAAVNAEMAQVDELQDELEDVLYAIEDAKDDYAIEREAQALPFRALVLPWTDDGEDERRFRKILLLILLLTLLLGWGVPLLKKPVDRSQPVVVPEHIAQLVKKRQEPPPQPEKKPEEKKEEKPKDKDEKKPTPEEKPKPVETQQARAVAETKGVLAFKNNFADLMEESSPSKLGAEARITDSGKIVSGAASRSMILSQAAGGSSGGINASDISRQGAGGGGGRSITGSGVQFARVESATGTGMAEDRPLSSGPGPSRTDEEIQIVFDRYKAALYRIYNRELRSNPTLRGKMVLRLTIQPDGTVSACEVKSSDLDSAELSRAIVERVLKFNFGAKAGVPAVTILYPIDFLPAS